MELGEKGIELAKEGFVDMAAFASARFAWDGERWLPIHFKRLDSCMIRCLEPKGGLCCRMKIVMEWGL